MKRIDGIIMYMEVKYLSLDYYLIPEVLLNPIWILRVLVTLDEVSIFILAFSIFSECREFKELCRKLIFTRRGLMV